MVFTNKIVFKKEIREAELLSPLLDFRSAVHTIEFRKEPLTHKWCRINIERAKRVKQAKARKSTDLMRIVEESRKKCFFCPENVEKATQCSRSTSLQGG